MAPIFPSLILSFFSILASLVLLLMLCYLLSTERSAPHIRNYPQKAIARNNTSTTKNPMLVSVIISARNEEEKIGRCISSLLGQTYANYEIIVVDDNSTDGTAVVSSNFEQNDLRVRTVTAGPKPEGWVGKSWPCQKGYEVSRGKLLIFVDADSTFDPGVIERCVTHFETASLDMFSISPRAKVEGVWAKATLPLVSAGINLLYPMKKVNSPRSDRAYVFGTFIMVKRDVYAAIGGHEAVRRRIVEDAAIAQLAKSKGYKLQVMVGDGLLATDWESDRRAVYHGMERVFSDSERSYGYVSLFNAILIFILGVYPTLVIIALAIYSLFAYDALFSNSLNSLVLSAGFTASILAVIFSIAISSNELKILSGKRSVGLAPLLFFLGYLLFASAIVTSTIKVSRGKVGLEWKGQRYRQELIIPDTNK